MYRIDRADVEWLSTDDIQNAIYLWLKTDLVTISVVIVGFGIMTIIEADNAWINNIKPFFFFPKFLSEAKRKTSDLLLQTVYIIYIFHCRAAFVSFNILVQGNVFFLCKSTFSFPLERFTVVESTSLFCETISPVFSF